MPTNNFRNKSAKFTRLITIKKLERNNLKPIRKS